MNQKKPTTKKPAARKPAAKKKAPVKPHTTEKKEEEKVSLAKTASIAAEAEKDGAETPVMDLGKNKTAHAVGRRKTAVAQANISAGNGTITVNHLPFEKYFQTEDLQTIVLAPLTILGFVKHVNVKAKVSGSGIHAQAESLRHALSRALISMNPESRRTLKKLGFLTRDSRVKERKKPGLKRARRAPQFSKR